MKIRTKEIIGSSRGRIDYLINDFLSKNNVRLIDIKFTVCDNTFFTQGYAIALLIYEDQRMVGG